MKMASRCVSGLLAMCLAVPASLVVRPVPLLAGAVQGRGTPVPAADVWTGTVTVTHRSSGTYRAEGSRAYLGFQGAQTTTFTLNGDGTASYSSTYRSSTDVGGEYAIPASGSGSGTTFGGVGYNGAGWDIVVDGGDDITTEVDYTAQDQRWAELFKGLIDLSVAMGLGPRPSLSAHVERGGQGVRGASVPSRGAATARTLTGSVSEQEQTDHLGGLPLIPTTTTVSWNLTRVPRPPKVAIYGPSCGCIVAGETETRLTFIAGAIPAGGEFSEFEVTPDGQMPEVVVNQGGEQPRLEITATKDTGPVTLKIQYTTNGRRLSSVPFRVEFCALEKIELADNEHDLAFDLDPKLEVEAKIKAWHNGKELKDDLTWEAEQIGSPTTQKAEPPSRRGEKITFTYQGLPEKNADFGPKALTLKANPGSCTCQQRETIRVFYPDVDDSHPGNEASPNWYYYWKQTRAASAHRSKLAFAKDIPADNAGEASPIAKYDPASGKMLIADRLFDRGACRDEVDRETHVRTARPHAVGIDCFGETVQHEGQHYLDALGWWGTPRGHLSTVVAAGMFSDPDFDQVPWWVELSAVGCSSFSQQSCADRPFADAKDAEINAYWTGWTWPLGSANAEDWSCGALSKQWTGKKCGPK